MKFRAVLFVMLILFVLPACESDTTYDVVILNGRVMDPETNFDAVFEM